MEPSQWQQAVEEKLRRLEQAQLQVGAEIGVLKDTFLQKTMVDAAFGRRG